VFSALLVLSDAFSFFLVCRRAFCCLGIFYVGLFSVSFFLKLRDEARGVSAQRINSETRLGVIGAAASAAARPPVVPAVLSIPVAPTKLYRNTPQQRSLHGIIFGG
jgi:hypothetical protein